METEKIYGMAPRGDGLGANITGYISVWAFCNYHNIKFIHLPFTVIGKYADNYTNKGNVGMSPFGPIIGYDSNELNYVNIFFGIPYQKEPVSNIKNLELFPYKGEVFAEPNKYLTGDFLAKVKNMYYKNDKPKFENSKDIVIHIRRNDVSETLNSDRFIPNSIYIKIINYLKKKYPTYKIHIMSDGKEEDFKELGDDKLIFHLNEDIFFTFHFMVTAKILVPAISSLSISAAWLTNNIVYVSKDVNLQRLLVLNHWKII